MLVAVVVLLSGTAQLGRAMGWCTWVQPNVLRHHDGFTGTTGCLMEMVGLQDPPGDAASAD